MLHRMLSGNDYLYGNSGSQELRAYSGNDYLDGKTGADTMLGGSGNDTYIVDNSGDLVVESLNQGTDSVKSSVTITLSDNVENLTLTGSGNIDGTGNSLNNVLTGNSGVNQLDGAAGADLIDGQAGADSLIGGDGNDTYIVDNAGDTVSETNADLVSGGTDIVKSSVSFVLGNNLENLTLTGTAAINGSGNTLDNTLIGNAAANTLNGGDGNDILIGGAGLDTFIGGLGDDTYVLNQAGELSRITENFGEGVDRIKIAYSNANTSALTVNLGLGNLTNVDDVTITGTGLFNITGNALDNTLTGNASASILDGGIGADIMVGGLGNDTYVVDDAGDTVSETSLLATEIDTVKSSITYALGSNVERLILTGTLDIDGTGNNLKNTLIGNSGANILDGGLGADTMLGGAGNDTYIVDNLSDKVYETITVTSTVDAGGTDTVESSVSFTLGSFVENLNLTGSANINGSGNGLANRINGNSGNNILNGAAGADILSGGLGDDTYIVDNIGDSLTENLAEGIDTVKSTINWTLGDNLENLTLTGSAAINGSGNTLDNMLIGNAAANTLDGGDGNDTLTGGAGLDTFIGGLGDDTYVIDQAGELSRITENIGEGVDLIKITYSNANTSALTVNLGLGNLTNVDNVSLMGTGLFNITGNALDNSLSGNASINILKGGVGADNLKGGLGNDALWGGGDGTDTFTFNTALNSTSNVDKIMDFTSGDTIALDDAIFAALTGGVLDMNIRSGAGFTTATTAEEHLIYNSTTGALYYDADGSTGPSTAKLFAYVNEGGLATSHPASLSAADFNVI